MTRNIIILDTNIWISYLLSRRYDMLANIILSNKLDIVTCNNLITEISEVLQREKFRRYVSKQDIEEAIKILIKLCRFIEMKSDYLTDKKDNYLIDLYQTSKAALLVTGDKRILDQAPKFGFNAVTLKQFEDQLKP
ncbi:MAG TPA: putative toxin-antitoxin system toxin component, PIN family [Prolixibacteraceae bacterium]|nr:putative toxin-antitoxin system toxin component, PIN family [Prolixibacteraceae bacterium]